MEVKDLNEVANDIAVSRLVLKGFEDQYQAFLESNPQLADLRVKIDSEKFNKDQLTSKLLEAMRGESLKSWKTEQAVFSRAVRRSVVVDSAYKKQVENRLKLGEEVEGFALNETEFMSIRINKQ